MARDGRPPVDGLPLVLAGPIVRRVTVDQVAVWIALRAPREVVLAITTVAGAVVATGRVTSPLELGPRLHVAVAVVDGLELEPGQRYGYVVYLRDGRDVTSILRKDAVPDAAASLCLTDRATPGFVVPPATLFDVDVLHGSCRKPHGPPPDAMARLAPLLDPVALDGACPQQLLLTGDQIYADDVAGPLLVAIVELADDLFDTTPATRPRLRVAGRELGEDDLLPYRRAERGLGYALAMAEDLGCQLARFEELAAMYLLVWSDVVWPTALPGAADVWPIVVGRKGALDDDARARYDEEAAVVASFRAAVPAVRRGLANIATYMMVDDHEVTDDLFFDARWTRAVLGEPAGRAIVRHALAAYAVFQGWGNDPAAMAPAIDAIAAWRATPSRRTEEELDRVLGLPPGRAVVDGRVPVDRRAVRWGYTVPGPAHRVVVLDTRTRRVFDDPTLSLIAPGEIAPAIAPPGAAARTTELTIVVSPAAVIEPATYEAQRWVARRGPHRQALVTDAESWRGDPAAYAALIDALFAEKRAVVLAGDVHYGYGASFDRGAPGDAGGRRVPCFISSPLCNSFTSWTRLGLTAFALPPLADGDEVTRYGAPLWQSHLARIQIAAVTGTIGVRHTWYLAAGGEMTPLEIAFRW